jgi:lysosomal acid lipase/cholesteryl ester hydrolase
MGRFDIPNSIDYVLNLTGEKSFAAYVGYSLGCAVFFISAIEYAERRSKVDVMSGLGPTDSVAHLKKYFRSMAPFVKFYEVGSSIF